MHDLHEADKIIKQLIRTAEKNGLKKISKAEIKVGTIIEHGEALNTKNLLFNIKNLAKGTALEKAKVSIKRIKGDYWEIVSLEGE